MKILLRYLFVSLGRSFLFCLFACVLLLFIIDLFGSLNEFIQNRERWPLVIGYYEAFLPGTLMLVLPPALLFATVYTLLDLNRTSQLVAIQACGIGIRTIFTPFLATGILASLLLYGLSLGLGGDARARQNEIMAELRSKPETRGLYMGQVYRERSAHRTWYVQQLSAEAGTAVQIDVSEQDSEGRDIRKVFAREGKWADGSWTFSDAVVETFNEHGDVATRQTYENFAAPDWHEAPKEMVKTLLQPDEMGVGDLLRTLDNTDLDAGQSARYRTQLFSLFVYPLSALVLLLIALPQGLQYGRRHVGAGVFNALFLLVSFYCVWKFSLALGSGGRISAPLATLAPMGGFAAFALWRIGALLGFLPPLPALPFAKAK